MVSRGALGVVTMMLRGCLNAMRNRICLKCHNFYRVSTIRPLHIRIKEHLNTRASPFHKYLIKSKNNDNNFSIKVDTIVRNVGDLRIKEASAIGLMSSVFANGP